MYKGLLLRMGSYSPIPFLTPVLLFLSNALAVNGHCASYASGTYTDGIVAQGAGNNVALSGSITMNYASDDRGSAAFFADDNGSITGTLDDLVINLSKPALAGMRARDGGEVVLTGPLTVSGQGDQVEGLSSLIGKGIHITGPVDINTKGAFSLALSSEPGAVTIDGPLTIVAEGSHAQGVFVRHITTPGVVTLNGKTDIQVSGSDAAGISGWNSIVYIHNALTITASDDAYAIQTMGSSQYMFTPSPTTLVADDPDVAMALTTRSSIGATQPNPQVINIDGRIIIQGQYNQLILDLDSGSHINSQLVEASDKGTFRLHFHKPDAKWTTSIGSVIGSGGTMVLDFVNGGVWALPLSEANRVGNGLSVAPLTIGREGHFVIQGHGTLLGHVETLMEEGEQATYLLVKKDITDSPLSLDLSSLTAMTDQDSYSLTLRQQKEGSQEYLYGTLTHEILLPEPEPLPLPPPPPLMWTLPENAALTRLLPVAMVDQSLASRLLTEMPAAADCHEALESLPMGNVRGSSQEITKPRFYPWALPLYEHIRARNLDLDAGHVGYKANLRGLALGLVHAMESSRWGIGIFAGNGDIDSRGDVPSTLSHADYRGGALFGSVSLNPVLVTAALVYLHSDHRLRQNTDVSRLASDSELDTWGGQMALAMPVPLGSWTVMPGAGLSYWHTRQRRGEVLDQSSGQVYGNGRSTETYWALPLSLAARGNDLFSTGERHIAAIPEVSVRFIPSWGDLDLPVTVWSNDQPALKLRQSGARRDAYRTEANIGMQVVGKTINSTVRYGVGKSRHTLSQQLSGEFTWVF